MITLVKFIRNRMSSSPNRLITRTLGKIGVIKPEIYASLDIRPSHDEFWFTEILSEYNPGTNKGVFVLKPLKRVGTTYRNGFAEPDVVRLIPGTFSIEERQATLYLYPSTANSTSGPNWILDMDVRKYLAEKYTNCDGKCKFNSIIVVFDEKPCDLFKNACKDEEKPILDLDDLTAELSSDHE